MRLLSVAVFIASLAGCAPAPEPTPEEVKAGVAAILSESWRQTSSTDSMTDEVSISLYRVSDDAELTLTLDCRSSDDSRMVGIFGRGLSSSGSDGFNVQLRFDGEPARQPESWQGGASTAYVSGDEAAALVGLLRSGKPLMVRIDSRAMSRSAESRFTLEGFGDAYRKFDSDCDALRR